MIKLLEKKEVKYTLGALGFGMLCYGVYRYYKYNRTEKPSSAINSSF